MIRCRLVERTSIPLLFACGVAALTAAAVACSEGSSGDSSGGVVSCDINQAGVHYCEEFHGATSSNTGCAAMAGVTPGTGCSRDGVAGSCSTGAYDAYFYGAAPVASAVATICPGGSVDGGSADGGRSDSVDGSPAGGAAIVISNSGSPPANKCTLKITGDPAAGIGTITHEGVTGLASGDSKGARISCNYEPPKDAGTSSGATQWLMGVSHLLSIETISSDSSSVQVTFDPGSPYHYYCGSFLKGSTGETVHLGSATFTITSASGYQHDNLSNIFYEIHGSGHAVCVPEFPGKPPGTVTVDLTF